MEGRTLLIIDATMNLFQAKEKEAQLCVYLYPDDDMG